MPRFGQAERENHMTGQYQGFTQRERAPNRVLTADIGSAHVLCPYSYSGTSLICVIATAQSVGHSVACVSRGVKRDISISLAEGCFWRWLGAHTGAVIS